MTKTELLALADEKPNSINDDLYAWATQAAAALREYAATIGQEPDIATVAYMTGYEKGKDAGIVLERERCAKLCDIECDGNGNIANGPIATERGKMLYEAMAAGAANCAAAIRGAK